MSNGVLFACESVCFSLVSSADRVRQLLRSLLVDFGCHPGGVAVVILEGRGHLHANLAGERSKPHKKKERKQKEQKRGEMCGECAAICLGLRRC